MSRERRVVVVGAGMAGLVTAFVLTRRGLDVVLVERMSAPGGKLRQVHVGDRSLDAGPTVFTMRWVFEELFEEAGLALDEHLGLRQAQVLARHGWPDGSRLDLFADEERTVDAITQFAGPDEARRYLAFSDRARGIFATLDEPFMRAPRPSLLSLIRRSSLRGLWGIQPFTTLWRSLEGHFRDPRLRQLFGRYATYCGSSPYASPATLMLVAHVESEGVWMVDGGMHQLAATLAEIIVKSGGQIRYGQETAEVLVDSGRANGVVLGNGERITADAVVVTADTAAIAGGWFGSGVRTSVVATPKAKRSLSAVTWSLVSEPAGFPLLRHTVFFSNDYHREFDDIFRLGRIPQEPTVYICAQDRGDPDDPTPDGPERVFCLVNAPPTGDSQPLTETDIERCTDRMLKTLQDCGLRLDIAPEAIVTTSPGDFDQLFPATGGALYGRASHGWQASFRRQGCRSRLPGLYVAGGSAHPGPGVPMAALSGRSAAAAVLADLGST